MRKDIQYRKAFLLKVDIQSEDVPESALDTIGVEDVEKVILGSLSDKTCLETIAPFSRGVFYICFRSHTLRDTFIVETWGKLCTSKMINYVVPEDGSKAPESVQDIPSTTDSHPSSAGGPTNIDDNSESINKRFKIANFGFSVVFGFPVYCIRFFHIYEGRGNDSKIDSFIQRVTGSKAGTYTIIRQKTKEGTLTGSLLVLFPNEDSRNHALRTLAQIKVSHNGIEVKYEEFNNEE